MHLSIICTFIIIIIVNITIIAMIDVIFINTIIIIITITTTSIIIMMIINVLLFQENQSCIRYRIIYCLFLVLLSLATAIEKLLGKLYGSAIHGYSEIQHLSSLSWCNPSSVSFSSLSSLIVNSHVREKCPNLHPPHRGIHWVPKLFIKK